MVLPKGFKTDISIVDNKIGLPRREEILKGITNDGTYLPRSVSEEDMDQSFIEMVNSDDGLSITIDDKKLPVIFLSIQRWGEFTKTWQFTDEYKNIEMPFITIVRRPDIQQGQNQAGLWNIPGRRTYTIIKVPTWDGVRRGVDLYKVPQPTSVDLTYEVRIFANKIKNINLFNNKIQRAFQSKQFYLKVKGHYMPLVLENISDESEIEDFENRRFYIQNFEIRLLGYLVNEDDYIVVPTINRVVNTIEVDEPTLNKSIIIDTLIKNSNITYNITWKSSKNNEIYFTSDNNVILNSLINVQNLYRIVIEVNNNVVFDGSSLVNPISLIMGDNVVIKLYKNTARISRFSLLGSIL
jgi:hypothetical protein